MIKPMFFSFAFLFLTLTPEAATKAPEKWISFTPQELAMTDTPLAPGARAVFLFQRGKVEGGIHTYHGALKILNASGRDLANFELPELVGKIQARTVNPDGTAREISAAEIQSKLLFKTRNYREQSKAIALPDVQVGSIVEVIYEVPLEGLSLVFFEWPFQGVLPCLESSIEFGGREQMFYNNYINDIYMQVEISNETRDGRLCFTARNIPPLPDEDFPPPHAQRAIGLVHYFVSELANSSGFDTRILVQRERFLTLFWENVGKILTKGTEDFLSPKDAVSNLRQSIVNAAGFAGPEEKALYDYVANHIRNTSFLTQEEKAQPARQAAKSKDKKNAAAVDSVIRNSKGNAQEIALLLVALLREAGIPACPAFCCGRNGLYFRRDILLNQFSEPLVAIPTGEGYRYLDPATPYCPYGHLAWFKEDTDVLVLPLNKESQILRTPAGSADKNDLHRKLDARFEGTTLVGKLEMTGHGNPDFMLRNHLNGLTDEERRAYLQAYLEKDFGKISITACEFRDLGAAERPLTIVVEFAAPDFLVETRTRILLKTGGMHQNQTGFFIPDQRRLPICLEYPYTAVDEFAFHFPAGMVCEQLPEPKKTETVIGRHLWQATYEGSVLTLQRTFQVKGASFARSQYKLVSGFYFLARKADDVTVVLRRPE